MKRAERRPGADALKRAGPPWRSAHRYRLKGEVPMLPRSLLVRADQVFE